MGIQFKTVCSICNAPQFQTPSGSTCINGHGGAPGKQMTFSSPMTKKERQWVDRNAPKCDGCGNVLGLHRQEQGKRICDRCEPALDVPAARVWVDREDLELVLADAMNTYANSIDTPDYAVRIAVELKE